MIDLREEPVADLRDHASIPSVFESSSVYDVKRLAGGFELVERAIAQPLRKNYDDLENPLAWSHALSTTESVLIAAFSRGQRVGGAIVAVAVPGLVAWSDEPGIAVLWDLRVATAHRRKSIATSLVHAAQGWAGERRCGELRVETQNTNVAACRFYLHNGFVLQEARHGAYPQAPEDVQLIWGRRRDG